MPKNPLPKIIPLRYSELFDLENKFLKVLPQRIFDDIGDLLSVENQFKRLWADSEERRQAMRERILKTCSDPQKAQLFADSEGNGIKLRLHNQAIDELSHDVQQQVSISVINPSISVTFAEFESLHHDVKNIWLELDCRIEKLFSPEMKTEFKSLRFCGHKPSTKSESRSLLRKKPHRGEPLCVQVGDLEHIAADVESGINVCRSFMKKLASKIDIPLPNNDVELLLISCIERLKIFLIELPTIHFIFPKPSASERVLYDMLYYDIPTRLEAAENSLAMMFESKDEPVAAVVKIADFWKSDAPWGLLEKMHSDYERISIRSESQTVLAQIANQQILELQDLISLEQIKRRHEIPEKSTDRADGAQEINATPVPLNIFRSTKTGYIISFQGSDEYPFDDLDGLFYLHKCLQNPGKSIPVEKLIALRRGANYVQSRNDLLDEESLDETKENYKERLKNLSEDRKEAEAINDEKWLDRINMETKEITRALGYDFGKDGKPRAISDKNAPARISVTKAISYAYRKLGGPLPELVKHLESKLDRGSKLCYNGQIDWQL